MDHGDDRQSGAANAGKRRLVLGLIGARLADITPVQGKFRDIGTRSEGLLTGTGNHDDTDGVFCCEPGHGARNSGPHRSRDGISTLGPVEDKESGIPGHVSTQMWGRGGNVHAWHRPT